MLVGLDIGGTKIEVKVLSDTGIELFVRRVATPNNYDDFINVVAQLIADTEKEVGAFASIGAGLPGAVSPVTGFIQNANSVFLNGNDVVRDLQKITNKSVSIANDANCFALSEAVDGAAKGSSVVFGAILGTGCGGGLVVNKNVLTGKNAIAGEWGHNPLPYYDPAIDGDIGTCYCGRKNCIEQFISGTGFAAQHNQKNQTKLNSKEIVDLAMNGQIEAKASYDLLVDQMARSFALLTNILDPDAIVLGGGMSNVDSLYSDVKRAMSNYIFAEKPSIHLVKAKFGDSSGVRGAAWLSRR
ncbi:ROK family protein [Vibrio hangzhouensis]|uniref:Fructokinase n=1 Tax=Vibrio hangzhouensis TaxID=462991 RepID=A0A1H5THP2_9VIBR|nr:ROK family protein [Vibrio hangzhouensis]SEF62382.1 fructokinase [Vibrio hangzhouensis]